MEKAALQIRAWGRRAVVAITVAFAALLVNTFAIEPFRLETTHHTVTAPVTRSLLVAHVSDLHTRGTGRREEHLLTALERESPDVIVVTGDTVERADDTEAARHLLARMHAPLGVWVVPGNWEHWSNAPLARDGAGSVHYLVNEATKLREDVWIVGVDDALAGSPDGPRALERVPAGVAVLPPRARDGPPDTELIPQSELPRPPSRTDPDTAENVSPAGSAQRPSPSRGLARAVTRCVALVAFAAVLLPTPPRSAGWS